MSPRTVVFVVGPSRFRAFGVSTPCIFRILLSWADSLRMSPRIRRISVVLSEPRVSVVRSAGIPENRSHRSIPTVFTAPLRAPGPLPPGPFGTFRLLFSGPLRRHGLRISAGRLRRFPVFSLFRCGILRDPFVVSVIRFETRMSGVPPNPVVMCLAAGARLPVVSCRDEPCGRGTAPVATDSLTGSFLSVKKRCRKEEGGRPACPFELILQVKHTGTGRPPGYIPGISIPPSRTDQIPPSMSTTFQLSTSIVAFMDASASRSSSLSRLSSSVGSPTPSTEMMLTL